MKQRLPEATNNLSLAIALHIAGMPIFRAWRAFTPESLKKLGFRTVEEAHAKRAQGKVEITNQHGPHIGMLAELYDKVSAGEAETIPDLYEKVGDDYRRVDEAALALKIATMTLKVRAQLVDSLALASNYVLRITDGKTTVDKTDPTQPVINFPACRLISANASEATKARILQ